MARRALAALAVVLAVVAAVLAGLTLTHGHERGEVRIATLAAGISTVDIIEDRNLGAKYGINVTVVRLGKTPEIAAALARGDVDVAIIPVEYAALWTLKGTNLKVIAVDMFQNQAILAVDPNIKTPKDLVGRIVGAFTPTSTYSMFKAYMKLAYNVSVVELSEGQKPRPDAINVINTPPGVMVVSLLRGDVDAIVAFEPIVSEALAQGAHVVASYTDLYHALGYTGDPVMIVYAARSDWVESHKDVVEALLKARADAASIWNTNQDYVVDLLGRLYKMDEEAARILIGRVKICTEQTLTPPLVESATTVLKIAYEGGFLPENPEKITSTLFYTP